MSNNRRIAAGIVLAASTAFTGMAHAASATYSYDALGRLVRVDDVVNAQTIRQTYQYDAAGNRTSIKRTPVAASTGIIPVGTSLNIVGDNVTLSVSVGGPLASGMITFYFNGVFAGTAPVIDGMAQIVFQGMSLGSYTVQAEYTGDGHYDSGATEFNIKIQNLAWLPAVLDLLLSEPAPPTP